MRTTLLFIFLLFISIATKAQNLVNYTYSQVQEFYNSDPHHIGWEYDQEDNMVSFANKQAGVLYAVYFNGSKVNLQKVLAPQSLINKVREIFDSKYKKVAVDTWIDNLKRVKYTVRIKEEVLYTTITPL